MSGSRLARERGLSMIEVLITLVLLAFGLLGIAGLQARMSVAEMEAYQRSQATLLLRDMADRIHANGKNAADYVTSSALGSGAARRDCSAANGAERDRCEWHNQLLGVSETLGSASVGGIIGARGCVEMVNASMPRTLRVAVAWQGLNESAAPRASACGAGLYGTENRRRVITADVVIACLQNDPATGVCVTP